MVSLHLGRDFYIVTLIVFLCMRKVNCLLYVLLLLETENNILKLTKARTCKRDIALGSSSPGSLGHQKIPPIVKARERFAVKDITKYVVTYLHIAIKISKVWQPEFRKSMQSN